MANVFRCPGKRAEETGEKGSVALSPELDRAGVGYPRGPTADEERVRGGVLVDATGEVAAPEVPDPLGTVEEAATTDEQMV